MGGKHILIIDDNPTVLGALSELLEADGYQVSRAQTLGEVDSQIHRLGDPFDLILVDVQMPDLAGDEIALILRTMRKSKAPIYLLSALEPAELARRAADVGASGYISKMAGTKALLARVHEILA
jgi:DNA-binding response OmpR family regulator